MRNGELLLHILAPLRWTNKLRAMDLAERCGISRRTILREISSISSAYIPILYDNGDRLLHERFLPPISFTSEEAGLVMQILKPRLRRGSGANGSVLRRIVDKLETCSMLKFRAGRGSDGLRTNAAKWGKG